MPNLVIENRAYPVPERSNAAEARDREEEDMWTAREVLEKFRRDYSPDTGEEVTQYPAPTWLVHYEVHPTGAITSHSRDLGTQPLIMDESGPMPSQETIESLMISLREHTRRLNLPAPFAPEYAIRSSVEPASPARPQPPDDSDCFDLFYDTDR